MSDEQWVTVQELLQDEIDGELEGRRGQWSAFREQIQWRLDQEAGAVARMNLHEQAIRAMVDEVDGEVASVSHRFEGAFRDEVERRIFRQGIEVPLWRRFLDALGLGATPPAWGMALAGSAAAVLIAVGLGLGSHPGGAPIGPGTVVVESLSFEGSAIVTVDEGGTVLILASAGE